MTRVNSYLQNRELHGNVKTRCILRILLFISLLLIQLITLASLKWKFANLTDILIYNFCSIIGSYAMIFIFSPIYQLIDIREYKCTELS